MYFGGPGNCLSEDIRLPRQRHRAPQRQPPGVRLGETATDCSRPGAPLISPPQPNLRSTPPARVRRPAAQSPGRPIVAQAGRARIQPNWSPRFHRGRPRRPLTPRRPSPSRYGGPLPSRPAGSIVAEAGRAAAPPRVAADPPPYFLTLIFGATVTSPSRRANRPVKFKPAETSARDILARQ
jgi:hypothetical protein